MKGKRKSVKVLSVILSAFMLVSMLPMFVFAGNTDPIEITAQPENISAAAGDEMSMTVVATNVASYQWQRSSDGGQTWGNISGSNSFYSGVKTDTLTIKVNNGTEGFVYRCTMKNSVCTLSTEIATVSVEPSLVIKEQPEDISGAVGDEVSMTVVATNVTSYQWQRSSDGGQTWGNISGSNSFYSGVKTDTLTIKVNNGTAAFVYRCTVKNSEYTIFTEVATASIEPSLKIKEQPENTSGAVGEEMSMTVVATNVTSYQWQRSSDGGQTWGNISESNSYYSGVKTDTLTIKVNNGTAGFVYRCNVKNSEYTIFTEVATVSVEPSLVIKEQPEDISGAVGDEVSMTVVATNVTSYQWQRSSDGGQTWGNISGSNSFYSGVKTDTLTIKVNNGTAAFVYRCTVKNSEYTIFTEVATASIEPSLKIKEQPENISGAVGEEMSMTVVATNVTSYQWQRSSDGGQTWGNISESNSYYSGVKTDTLTVLVSNGTAAFVYRCVLKNSEYTIYTKVATASIEPSLKIKEQPENISGAVGEEMSITVVATNVVSYQWQRSSDGGQTWGNISESNSYYSGVKTDTLTVLVSNGTAAFVYRCVLKNSECTVNTDVVTVTVDKSIVLYNVTYNANGGCFGDPSVTEASLKVRAGAGIDTVYLPENGNHALDGWYLDPECTESVDPLNFVPTGDVTFYAKWSEGATVTLNANGGYFESDDELTMTFPFNTCIGEYSLYLPERTGYVFEGWYFDKDCTDPVDLETYLVTGNVTLYANWLEAVALNWNANGGAYYGDVITTTCTQYVAKNQQVEDIGYFCIPERSGYAFAGWYEDQACTRELYLGYYVALNNAEYYAKWVVGCEVTWNANGGVFYGEEVTTSITETLPKNQAISRYQLPDKDGKVFAGWYFDQSLKNPVDFENFVLSSNVTFYAKWADPVEVTWVGNGGYFDGDLGTTSIVEVVPKGQTLPCTYYPDRDGYMFDGWYLDLNFSVEVDFETYKPDKNVTFYAKWNNGVEITWNANGGYLFEDPDCSSYTETVTMGQPLEYSLLPVKKGYVFVGWYLDIDLSRPLKTSYVPKQNDTFYAKWAAPISITWDANGGYLNGDLTCTTYSEIFASGTAIDTAPTVIKEGSVFDGWYLDSSFIQPIDVYGYAPKTDTVFYAKWKSGITITFETNGGSIDGKADYSESFMANQPISSLPIPKRDGYMFVAWYADLDFNTVVRPGEYVPTQDTVLYAQWSSMVEIIYDANGGKMVDGNPTFYCTTNVGGAKPYIPYSNSGYVFDAWYYDKELTQPVPESAKFYKSCTLYAKWLSPDEPISPKVTCENIVIWAIFPGANISGSNLVEPDVTQAEFGLFSDPECTNMFDTAKITGSFTLDGETVYKAEFDASSLRSNATYYVKQTKAVNHFGMPQEIYQVTFDSEGKPTYTNLDYAFSTTDAVMLSNRFDLNQPPEVTD